MPRFPTLPVPGPSARLEPAPVPAPGWRQLLADFGPVYAASGFTGFLFAASGPTAIILSVGTRGGLSPAELASWIFGVFFVNGVITVAMSWRYREPLCVLWTIPGTVLVGPALEHQSFPEVIGAFYATAVLILVLGASGWVKRAMAHVPMPVVMGMVAGVFLRFGLDLVHALHADAAIAVPMLLAFLALSAWPAAGRRLPPLIGALLVGAAAALLLGRFSGAAFGTIGFARPVIQAPAWSFAAMVELVVPLAITVLVVQNGQGFAVLRAGGHRPPFNAVTVACGIGSLLAATVGAVSSCLTGPTNALLIASGERRRHYTAAVFTGLLAIGFGLLAPTFTGWMLAAPREFIMALGGLAMLRVLQGAFITSFGGRFTLGALVSFLVTVADHPVLNIGAAFWGLLAGLLVSRLLEKADFAPTGGTN
ncbi:benzoate/H(+) symporter BenE family transporter [Roseomonas sp. OT10]|uniref:benzoate/H(+) symporter BenE family transporter n=1 Tax=Roseomonas cutis TaxID=2897332 RepID=UPI001E5B83AF|nr:benzoate/H(+) symporter BenE family transporter [Roseomonas sp. OT10]UFN48656.1 benzoate/H(+) symporter BenE family transporter [Roseomonas sp. OT10]